MWSCGVTLYVMLVGAYPFEDPTDPKNFKKALILSYGIFGINYIYHGPSRLVTEEKVIREVGCREEYCYSRLCSFKVDGVLFTSQVNVRLCNLCMGSMAKANWSHDEKGGDRDGGDKRFMIELKLNLAKLSRELTLDFEVIG